MNFFKNIKIKILNKNYTKRDRWRFLEITNYKGNLLDVGCGNDSPYWTKKLYPNIIYTGIDVGDYNQSKPNDADNYIIVKPEEFAESITNIPELFDTVISAHNLEHCNDRDGTLQAIIKVLKPGGFLYISFPTEKSVKFPKGRKYTLNYFDDKTHKEDPPKFKDVLKILKKNNMKILFSSKSYKPFLQWFVGFYKEKESKQKKEVLFPWTWAFWGFESIIWARKSK